LFSKFLEVQNTVNKILKWGLVCLSASKIIGFYPELRISQREKPKIFPKKAILAVLQSRPKKFDHKNMIVAFFFKTPCAERVQKGGFCLNMVLRP